MAAKVPPMAASPLHDDEEETVPPQRTLHAEETEPPAQETETELPAEETVLSAEVAPAQAAGSKSPAEVAEVPEVAETPAQEKPAGIFQNIDPVAHQQKQKELKEKIIAEMEERRAKIENERMAQQDAPQFAPPEELEDPEKNSFGQGSSFQCLWWHSFGTACSERGGRLLRGE